MILYHITKINEYCINNLNYLGSSVSVVINFMPILISYCTCVVVVKLALPPYIAMRIVGLFRTQGNYMCGLQIIVGIVHNVRYFYICEFSSDTVLGRRYQECTSRISRST